MTCRVTVGLFSPLCTYKGPKSTGWKETSWAKVYLSCKNNWSGGVVAIYVAHFHIRSKWSIQKNDFYIQQYPHLTIQKNEFVKLSIAPKWADLLELELQLADYSSKWTYIISLNTCMTKFMWQLNNAKYVYWPHGAEKPLGEICTFWRDLVCLQVRFRLTKNTLAHIVDNKAH